MLYCGIDVAKRKHAVAVVDERGQARKAVFEVENTHAGLMILLSDHLGSNSRTVKAGTNAVQTTTLYKPWGETRYTSGMSRTNRQYTGQISEPDLKKKDFDQFRAEHIFFYEARELWGISNRRLMGYIRRGNLAPIAGPDLGGCYTYLFPLRNVEWLARHLQKLQQKHISAAVPN